MILSASEYQRRIQEGTLVITSYSPESQQPASYDLRSAEDAVLVKGGCTLIHTLERVELPADLAGTMRCRSSFGRRGVLLGGGFIDPGFRGQLTLSLVNMGNDDLNIASGERAVQLILHEVTDGAHHYAGRYQDSQGTVEAR